MRRAAYLKSLAGLRQQHAGTPPDLRVLSSGVTLDLADPCTVLGGRNGAGKSRILRRIGEEDGVNGLYIDLHYLAEQVLMILRSREDFDAMTEEYEALNISDETRAALGLIVGREYTNVEWYALEVEPFDALVRERFKWGREQCLIPYFRVAHKSRQYSSRDMGLGEFCVHFLLWIIEQYRDAESITILLDEPDAYLPPVGVSILLYHIVDTCLKHDWKVVLSTHSEEMIRLARSGRFFVLLRVDEIGDTVAVHSLSDPRAGDTLLSPRGMRRVLFCEDESAHALIRAILQSERQSAVKETSVVWGSGHGYMRKLQGALPRPPQPDIDFALIFDGDQRGRVDKSANNQWPVLFLPSEADPDSLFKTLSKDPPQIAQAIGADLAQLAEVLDALEGEEPHDWVNALGDRFGRLHVLNALAALWCRTHESDVGAFLEELSETLGGIDE